jgi:hypothetical protein
VRNALLASASDGPASNARTASAAPAHCRGTLASCSPRRKKTEIVRAGAAVDAGALTASADASATSTIVSILSHGGGRDLLHRATLFSLVEGHSSSSGAPPPRRPRGGSSRSHLEPIRRLASRARPVDRAADGGWRRARLHGGIAYGGGFSPSALGVVEEGRLRASSGGDAHDHG